MYQKPKNQKTFVVKHKSEETGEVTEGQFTVKRLAIRDRSEIGRIKSQLSGGMYCVRDDEGNPTGQGLDEDTEYLNGMIAHLQVALIQKPEWFNLSEIADLGLVREVYERVWDFEGSFFRTGQEDEKSEASNAGNVGKANGVEEHQGSRTGNHPTPVVDQEVQAALDA